MTSNGGYATLGAPIALTKEMIDPVQSCVGNTMFQKVV